MSESKSMDELRAYVRDATLFIQSIATKTPEQINLMFQRSYQLYTKYDVEHIEHRQAEPEKRPLVCPVCGKELRRVGKSYKCDSPDSHWIQPDSDQRPPMPAAREGYHAGEWREPIIGELFYSTTGYPMMCTEVGPDPSIDNGKRWIAVPDAKPADPKAVKAQSDEVKFAQAIDLAFGNAKASEPVVRNPCGHNCTMYGIDCNGCSENKQPVKTVEPLVIEQIGNSPDFYELAGKVRQLVAAFTDVQERLAKVEGKVTAPQSQP